MSSIALAAATASATAIRSPRCNWAAIARRCARSSYGDARLTRSAHAAASAKRPATRSSSPSLSTTSASMRRTSSTAPASSPTASTSGKGSPRHLAAARSRAATTPAESSRCWAASASSRSRRNCHRSMSTHGGGASEIVSPSMRNAGQPAPVARPGSSTARTRDSVTRRLRPAARMSRSGHIRSASRSRRTGPARTSSSSSVRTRRRRSSATSTSSSPTAICSSPSNPICTVGRDGSGSVSISTAAPALVEASPC